MVALLARAPNSSLMAGLRARLNNCCAIVSNIQPMLATLSTNQWYPVNSRHHAYFCPPAPSTVGDMKLLFYIVAATPSPTFSAAIWHASITTPREFSTFCGAMWGGALALRARLLPSPPRPRVSASKSSSPPPRPAPHKTSVVPSETRLHQPEHLRIVPREHRFPRCVAHVPRHQFAQHVAEIGGHRQVAPLIKLLFFQARPLAVDFAAFHPAAHHEHAVGDRKSTRLNSSHLG